MKTSGGPSDIRIPELWENLLRVGITWRKFLTLLGAGGATAVLVACGQTTITTGSKPATSSTTVAPSGQTVTLSLVASKMAFNKSTITVPAGAQVVLTLDNQDSGIPHYFSLYTDSSASKSIFVGQNITRAGTTIYKFNAPNTPGNYFFRCDVHPRTMVGTFVVQ